MSNVENNFKDLVSLHNIKLHLACHHITPHQDVQKRNRPDLSNFRIFGETVFALNKCTSKGKVDKHGLMAKFLGYDASSKVYRIYLVKIKKVIITRDIRFTNSIDVQIDPQKPTSEIRLKSISRNYISAEVDPERNYMETIFRPDEKPEETESEEDDYYPNAVVDDPEIAPNSGPNLKIGSRRPAIIRTGLKRH